MGGSIGLSIAPLRIRREFRSELNFTIIRTRLARWSPTEAFDNKRILLPIFSSLVRGVPGENRIKGTTGRPGSIP